MKLSQTRPAQPDTPKLDELKELLNNAAWWGPNVQIIFTTVSWSRGSNFEHWVVCPARYCDLKPQILDIEARLTRHLKEKPELEQDISDLLAVCSSLLSIHRFVVHYAHLEAKIELAKLVKEKKQLADEVEELKAEVVRLRGKKARLEADAEEMGAEKEEEDNGEGGSNGKRKRR
ncbi:MAG: hypothetical protein LQ338_006224 [Usnochroma carphineum]|nr:MAG: hypothetical protein LQ338_006224 [Usnochroma carphineum]